MSEGADGRTYGPKECGSCRLWRPILEDERGPVGPCRLGVRTGDFPGTAPSCERYLSRDRTVPTAPPPEPTRRRARRAAGPMVHRADEVEWDATKTGPVADQRAQGQAEEPAPERAGGLGEPRLPARSEREPSTPPARLDVAAMTREEFAQAIREALADEAAPVRLAPRWEGGTLLLKPGDESTQPKDIPLDSLFHKVVMIRDRLRVLEQRINGHEKLSDAEKIELQQYVTRCYGSLTTFNLLFKDEREKFVGDKT